MVLQHLGLSVSFLPSHYVQLFAIVWQKKLQLRLFAVVRSDCFSFYLSLLVAAGVYFPLQNQFQLARDRTLALYCIRVQQFTAKQYYTTHTCIADLAPEKEKTNRGVCRCEGQLPPYLNFVAVYIYVIASAGRLFPIYDKTSTSTRYKAVQHLGLWCAVQEKGCGRKGTHGLLTATYLRDVPFTQLDPPVYLLLLHSLFQSYFPYRIRPSTCSGTASIPIHTLSTPDL